MTNYTSTPTRSLLPCCLAMASLLAACTAGQPQAAAPSDTPEVQQIDSNSLAVVIDSATIAASEAGNSVELDPESPYWYDPKQEIVEFSNDGHTLDCYPRNSTAEAYVVPAGVNYIEERAFLGSKHLQSVVVPASVTHIGMAAFESCESLRKVTLQAHLDTLPFRCFSWSPQLRELHLADKRPPVIEAFEDEELATLQFFFSTDILQTCRVYVPRGAKRLYRKAYGWRQFKRITEE